ncbi:hypothetical protein HN011_010279 [Eciton burchellii]|nr:hypothetical protein HN011_010279 [Eciton burchellii]
MRRSIRPGTQYGQNTTIADLPIHVSTSSSPLLGTRNPARNQVTKTNRSNRARFGANGLAWQLGTNSKRKESTAILRPAILSATAFFYIGNLPLGIRGNRAGARVDFRESRGNPAVDATPENSASSFGDLEHPRLENAEESRTLDRMHRASGVIG